ncbi:natural killer cell receptor 2B4 [Perognathus longimembris pacificus]|uniref:natural killer cell receptor 2B4 n=1 Tax=Perognathus longimembris pacificus TaxID=214514 RepID=UPI002018AC22|nr:natural killer cell receptor 2B4 [Perognathus longimembris pacificus]
MLGQVITLTVLLFFKGQQGQKCPDSTDHRVISLSGKPIKLEHPKPQPKTQIYSVEWKMQLPLKPSVILTSWKNDSNLKNLQNNLQNTTIFDSKDLSFLIESAKPQNSSLYILEVTYHSGLVCPLSFNVSVLDHVEKPKLLWQWTALDERVCQVSLSCLVSRDDYVSYTWYRGNEVIATQRNYTYVEDLMDDSDPHTYTCNVSNLVSWDSDTLNLTQGCLRGPSKSQFLLCLVIILILVILFVGTLTGWYVWKQKRKQSQTSPQRILTVYDDVQDLRVKRNQKQNEVQKSPGEGTTIYSMVRLQSSASTSEETTKTLYSVVQNSRKKKNCSPSVTCTIYEEVGKQCPKARTPARLSQKELESLDIYP